VPEQVDPMARLTMALGLQEQWTGSGFAPAAPRVVYGSRRRGSAFSPPRPARTRSAPEQAAPRANRVKRGTRTPS